MQVFSAKDDLICEKSYVFRWLEMSGGLKPACVAKRKQLYGECPEGVYQSH